MAVVKTTVTKSTLTKSVIIKPIDTRPTTDINLGAIDAQRLGDQYLADVLGPSFHVSNGFFGNGLWHFLIRSKDATDSEPMGVGAKLIIDVQQHAVIPLTDEQVQDILEIPDIQRANRSGTIARDAEGHILRYQARGYATDYLRDHLSIYYSAIRGLLVPFPQKPVWQFTIRFRMASVGEIEPLGIIDIDALTGEPIPLETTQKERALDRVHAIVQYRQQTPT